MKLRELLNGVPVASCAVDLEMEIAGVSYDSRATQPGDLFVAMTGYATDGHKYIATALEKGAAAVLCQNLPEGDGPYIRTADSRRALAVIGANWFGHPAEEMTMIAVTGTCGKTTTTYLLKAILEQAKKMIADGVLGKIHTIAAASHSAPSAAFSFSPPNRSISACAAR